MNHSSPATGKETRPPEAAQESHDEPAGGFRAELPLAILESIRQHDRPAEVLEDEDLTASLPRRLGLTGVVESQIHRYRIARKRRERISHAEVGDLLRLVLRRPDSEPILRQAGHEIARNHRRAALHRVATAARVLPDFISTRVAKRVVRRLLNRTAGGARVRVTRRPFSVEMNGAVTARADSSGTACILYGAAIEEAVQSATGRRPRVEHAKCAGRGAAVCLWEVEIG